VPAANAGTWYAMDATPLMIVPLNCNVPASVAMVTLWGMAASLLVNVSPNGTPARPVSEVGANTKSRASIMRTTGAAVGFGFGVGLRVGLGVGSAVLVGDDVGAAVGFRVGAGVGARLGLAVASAGEGVAALGDAAALGSVVGECSSLAAVDGAMADAASDADEAATADGTSGSVGEGPDAEPPHAGMTRQQAMSSGPATLGSTVRETGIAAL